MKNYTIFAGVNGAGKTSIYKSIYYEENINLAKENGFYVSMNYIGVQGVDIAKERVAIRVSKGGHGIPDEAIERRYEESLLNLNKVIDICDRINIYDNTDMFKLVMVFDNGEMIWKDKKIPEWLNISFE